MRYVQIRLFFIILIDAWIDSSSKNNNIVFTNRLITIILQNNIITSQEHFISIKRKDKDSVLTKKKKKAEHVVYFAEISEVVIGIGISKSFLGDSIPWNSEEIW